MLLFPGTKKPMAEQMVAKWNNKKFFAILYLPYKWLIFFPILFISTLVFGALAVLISALINQKIGSFIGGVLWARFNSYLTPIVVKVTGKGHIHAKQSYVIVANHQSYYDIFVLYGWLGIDIKWVMKQELRKIPGLGIGSEKVGHIFIDRSSAKSALTSIEAAKKKIVNGTSIVFFPEGTRSLTGRMNSFKKGAFKMALELELPVLPVTIIGTKNILPSGTISLLPGFAKLIVHAPIEITKYKQETIDALAGKAREVIREGLIQNGVVQE